MSDLYYRSPVDDLLGSPLIQSREEALAEGLINDRNNLNKNINNSKKNFQQTLQETANEKNNPANWSGCHPLIPIDCSNANKAIEQSNEDIQKQIENSLGNILNASKPGYRKILPFKDQFGNQITDETPGPLQKTNWQLDLGIDGLGTGFKLANGEYTRDGRFKFDAEGRLVSVNNGIPLEICYEEGAPIDWSLKQLKIDFDGTVSDKLNEKKLGKIVSDINSRSKIMQYYIERSNVNLPLEFMGLQQKLRLIDLNNSVFSTGARLDSEAIQLLRGL